jgi:hypothetical protein
MSLELSLAKREQSPVTGLLTRPPAPSARGLADGRGPLRLFVALQTRYASSR